MTFKTGWSDAYVGTLQSLVDNFLDSFWKLSEIVLFLGVVAVGLAVIGIYGVVAFSVRSGRWESGWHWVPPEGTL